MKKVSIIFSHWNTFRWTAIAVHQFKKFQFPLEWELIIADNSVGHPSIKVITETSLGEGVKVVQGEPDFPSHGRGNEIALGHATGSHIFFTESDAFPIQDAWGNEYVKASASYDLVGPEIPQGSGRYIHPAGSLYDRKILDHHKVWRESVSNWLFCPDAAIELATSSRPYHVVCSKDFFESRNPNDSLRNRVAMWQRTECMQEMRSFEDDTFENYMLRTGILHWTPQPGKEFHNKIGFEAGQHLAYFAQSHGYNCLKAPTHLKWMDGHQGGQAAYADVFGGFRHVWCGTSSFCNGIAPDVKSFKMAQMEHYFSQLPESLRKEIELLEKEPV